MYQTIFTGGIKMKKALYINIGGEGHVNPTLGLVNDLVKRGEHITYYSSNHFEEKSKKPVPSSVPLIKRHTESLQKVWVLWLPSLKNIYCNF